MIHRKEVDPELRVSRYKFGEQKRGFLVSDLRFKLTL